MSNPERIFKGLRDFDLKMIKDDSVVLFIGKRRSGKSFAVRDLCHRHRDIPLGMIFSGTEKANPFFSDFFPNSFIFSNYDPELIQTLLSRQIGIKKRNAREGNKIDGRAMVILDDMMDDAKIWTKSKPIKTIFFNGRHYSLFFIITLQYPIGMGPSLRTNVDWIFIMRENQNAIRKKIFDNYAGCFGKQDIFDYVMENLEEYNCLVIDNNTKSARIEDQVYKFKADKRENFNFGCDLFWNLNSKIPDSDDEEEYMDYKKARR